MRDKKGQTSQWGYIAAILLALGTVAAVILIYLGATGKLSGVLEFIKNLARFGR